MCALRHCEIRSTLHQWFCFRVALQVPAASIFRPSVRAKTCREGDRLSRREVGHLEVSRRGSRTPVRELTSKLPVSRSGQAWTLPGAGTLCYCMRKGPAALCHVASLAFLMEDAIMPNVIIYNSFVRPAAPAGHISPTSDATVCPRAGGGPPTCRRQHVRIESTAPAGLTSEGQPCQQALHLPCDAAP